MTLALAACAFLALATPASAATYDPLDVIPYDTWRASSSMTAADVQTFLEALPGPLKTQYAGDINGVKKRVSQIIWDAAHHADLNPKIILATLQKEQSLLTVSNSSNAARYVKAMGYGVYGTDPITGKTINRYPGLGNQIWSAAHSLASGRAITTWLPNKPITVNSGSRVIRPDNASTYALYTYTPYYPQRLVWDIYVQYFGDPHAAARLRPVYRFRSPSTGAYYYTAAEGTRYNMITKLARHWTYGGVSFTVDTSSSVNTQPLYRIRNKTTGKYIYTAYKSTLTRYLGAPHHHWELSGTVGFVSTTRGSGDPVYRLVSKGTGGVLFTRYLSTKTRLTSGKGAAFSYTGIGFYLGRSTVTTTPVGP